MIPMRRKDKSQSQEWCQERLKKSPYGVLSILDSQARPYGVPLNYYYQEGKIYFHGAQEGEKVRAIGAGTQASFSLVYRQEVVPDKFSSNYESVICFGQVKILEDPQEKRQALEGLIKKYSKDYEKEGLDYIDRALAHTQVFVMTLEETIGKKNQEETS